MTDLVTKHDAQQILVICINTEFGPRTVISGVMPLQDATLISAALRKCGHYAEAREPGSVLSLASHLEKHKLAQAKRSGGIIKFPRRLA